jgi:ferritin-like metal-binding protein YciE
MRTLIQLFVDQLQDAYSAENQLVKALPQMAKAASSAELRAGIEQHLEETKNQVKRLEEAARLANADASGKTCEAMEGLIAEGKEMIAMKADGNVKDAGLIAAAQKVEHYEIALYGCLCTWAEELGMSDIKNLLHETLEEEKHTDAKLTELAEQRINSLARR